MVRVYLIYLVFSSGSKCLFTQTLLFILLKKIIDKLTNFGANFGKLGLLAPCSNTQ